MLRLLSDHSLRQRLIAGGLERVRETFDNSRWIEQLAEIFRRHNPFFR
jgi:hypothetical protein